MPVGTDIAPLRSVATLRQIAGKRDHSKVLSEDDYLLRLGPNFDWLMGNLQRRA